MYSDFIFLISETSFQTALIFIISTFVILLFLSILLLYCCYKHKHNTRSRALFDKFYAIHVDPEDDGYGTSLIPVEQQQDSNSVITTDTADTSVFNRSVLYVRTLHDYETSDEDNETSRLREI